MDFADRMVGSMLIGGLLITIAGGGFLGNQVKKAINKGDKDWEITQPLASQVRYIASGSDGILSNAEGVEMLRSLGVPAGLSEGESIYFRRPKGGIWPAGDYASVWGETPGGTRRFIGDVSQDTLRSYVETHRN